MTGNAMDQLLHQVADLRERLQQDALARGLLTMEQKRMQDDIKAIKESNKEMLELFETLKGGFKVLGWLGNFAKWVGGIAAGCAAAYAFYQKMTGKI